MDNLKEYFDKLLKQDEKIDKDLCVLCIQCFEVHVCMCAVLVAIAN